MRFESICHKVYLSNDPLTFMSAIMNDPLYIFCKSKKAWNRLLLIMQNGWPRTMPSFNNVQFPNIKYHSDIM